MVTVTVNLSALGADWSKPCQMAIDELNQLFKKGGIPIKCVTGKGGHGGPSIEIKVDPSIGKNMVHGKTSTAVSGGKMIKATVGLPKELKFSVPWGETGLRSAGAGARSVIAGHEIVHALMHHTHNSHLMAQTLSVEIGDDASGDKLKAKDVLMPPLQLSNATIGDLKAAWR